MSCLPKIKSVNIDSFSFNLLTLFYCCIRYTRVYIICTRRSLIIIMLSVQPQNLHYISTLFVKWQVLSYLIYLLLAYLLDLNINYCTLLVLKYVFISTWVLGLGVWKCQSTCTWSNSTWYLASIFQVPYYNIY